MFDALDVRGPFERRRILRPRDDESAMRQPARGLDEQALQHRLPVVAVGSQIAEVPLRRLAGRSIDVGVRAAIKRLRARRRISLAQMPQGRSAGEGKVRVKLADLPRRDVGRAAGPQRGQRHGRVDVVEANGPSRHAERDIDDSDRHPAHKNPRSRDRPVRCPRATSFADRAARRRTRVRSTTDR